MQDKKRYANHEKSEACNCFTENVIVKVEQGAKHATKLLNTRTRQKNEKTKMYGRNDNEKDTIKPME